MALDRRTGLKFVARRVLIEDSSRLWSAGAAAALFVVTGSVLIMPGGLPEALASAVYARPWIAAGAALLLPFAGLAIGWMNNFPRWSYPYVGFAVIFSVVLAGLATPRFTLFGIPVFGTEAWGWRAALPLVITGVASMLVNRSVRPVPGLRRRFAEDRTLITWTMFGFLPLFVVLALEDVDGLYASIVRVATPLIMAGAAFSYMWSGQRQIRALIIIAGVALVLTMTSRSVIVGLVVGTLIALPAAIDLGSRRRESDVG